MRLPLSILGAALLGAAAVTAPPATPLPTQARHLIRPVILPYLWGGLGAAERDGTPEEYAARGRVLMGLIPEWTEGQVHLAGQLAFDASLAQRSVESALDRLLAGLDLLETAIATATSPADREVLRQNQARFLFTRCRQDPALAQAFQARRGSSPTVWVERYLRDIPRLKTAPHLQSELGISLLEGMAIDLRLGTSPRQLLAALNSAEALLDDDPDQAWARRQRVALEKLRSYLQHPDESTYAALADEPALDTIRAAIASRRNPAHTPR